MPAPEHPQLSAQKTPRCSLSAETLRRPHVASPRQAACRIGAWHLLMGVVCCVRASSLLDGNVTVGVSGGNRARWRPSA